MALREVLQFPDPRLKRVSAPIETITDELRELASQINNPDQMDKRQTNEGVNVCEKIETPIFMPVATSAAIKGLHGKDLIESSDPQIILANTYHLYLRPGDEVIKNSGGIHNFMSWDSWHW